MRGAGDGFDHRDDAIGLCPRQRRCVRGVGGDDAEGVPSEGEPRIMPRGVPLRDEGESVRQKFRSTLVYLLMLTSSEVKLQIEVGLLF